MENLASTFYPGTAGRTKSDDVGLARLIETLALRSVSESTKKKYLGKRKTWAKERVRHSLGPWRLEADGVDSADLGLWRRGPWCTRI